MADYSDPRYRPPRDDDRTPEPDGDAARQAQSDPLAELARLIGQSDPFADAGRRPQRRAYDPAPQSYEPAPAYDDGPAYARYDDAASAYEPHAAGADRYAEDGYAAAAPPQDRFGPAADGWPQPQSYAPPPRAYDPHAEPVHRAPTAADRRYDSGSYVDPRAAADDPFGFHNLTFATRGAQPEPAADHGADPLPQPDPFAPPGHEAAAYDRMLESDAARPQEEMQAPPPFVLAGGKPPPDDFYDDAEPPRSRKGLATVMAVAALAVLGTAGAFAYRTLLGGPGAASPPPVIRASAEPTKIVPPQPPAGDATPARLTYDRSGDRSQNEQVVSRQERPVDINNLVRNSEPRTVFPGAPAAPVQGGAPVGSAAAGPPAPSAFPPNVIAEPRRVRTVPIRPDQPEPASQPQTIGPPAPAASRTTIASVVPMNTPMNAPANAPLDVAPPVPLTPPAATAPQRPAAPPRPQTSAGPLSLSPDGNPPVQQPAARPAAPPPARVAAAPATGGFVVQVASQRSEADAQTAYRSIQARYPAVLGGQQSFIKRADLGERGTYYRAVVGPFGSRAEAVQLCTSLKAAGGDCVVQTN